MDPFKAVFGYSLDDGESSNTPQKSGKNVTWTPDSHFPEPSKTESPTAVASGAKTSAELLRRLSLVDTNKPDLASINPKEAYPDLHLSGRIISAAVCIPFGLGLGENGEWETSSRRGTSALFDGFAQLSKPGSGWDHIMVGWTGEIKDLKEEEDHDIPTQLEIELLKKRLGVASGAGYYKPKKQVPQGTVVPKATRERLEELLLKHKNGKTVPVWLYDEDQEGKEDIALGDQARWRRYAEHDIYTLFHYKQHEPTDGMAERKRFEDYQRLNLKFADKIMEIYKPGDVIWVHDYHLLLLPNLLRQRITNVYVGFFLHVPFPSSEFLKCLGRRKETLTGVLGANMIGFQTYNYSRHFASCCTRILGFEAFPAGVDAYGAHIAVDVFPIGIDATTVAQAAYGDQEIDAKMIRLKDLYSRRKIIVGRDRLDTVRGVAQKLQAYEVFLEKYPEWRGKVVLVQVTSPTSVEEEKEDSGHKIANKVEEHISRINNTYGGLEYTPVYHYPKYLPSSEYYALLRLADVGLITSVRDGMNSTGLEYVLCQRENHGPLILSEFSGTASSLTDAIHINPWDLAGVADAINKALTMSDEEKETQHKSLYKHVVENNVQAWQQKFLHRLLTNLASFHQSNGTPALDKDKLLVKYRSASRRIFMFDYDGTLTPIVRDPQQAIPSDRIIRTIKTLAKDKRNSVWIISGRDQAFLDEWMGHIPELGLSAEHGSFVRQPLAEEWDNLTEKFDMGWQEEVINVFQHYTERTQGSFIERKRIALTWHFRRSDPEYGAFQARECKEHLERTVAANWDVEVMNGKANLEVRPSFVNKGEIAKRLVEESANQGGRPDFVLCLGDDFTDEDMFRALKSSSLPKDEVFAVTVGASSKKTEATWHLLEPADVIATVQMLNEDGNPSGSGTTSPTSNRK